jgi:hypothetical protein
MSRHSGREARVLPLLGALALVLLAGPRAATADDVQSGRAFRCELKQQSGLAEADARTASDLICAELRRESAGLGAYAVTLGALGQAIVVVATREDGTASLTVQVANLEEMPLAARRIAAALAHGRTLEAGQRVDNLLQSETRSPLSKKGSLKFSTGVLDIESPGFGARSVGFSLGLLYTTPRFALPVEARFAWGGTGYPDADLGLAALSVGARRYLSDRDASAFVGGGLGVLHLSAQEGTYPDAYAGGSTGSSRYFYDDRTTAAPYVELGLELLRLHRGRVLFQVRADFPTGALEMPAVPVTCYDPRYCDPRNDHVIPAQSRYVVPVSFGVGVAF